MSDIKKLGRVKDHVSAVFNAYEVAFIGTHLNTVCDTVNKLRTEVNDLKKERKESTNVVD